MIRTDKERANYLASELSSMLSEFNSGELTEEGILGYFSSIMENLDDTSSRMCDIAIKVLESPEFGETGKNAATGIKVRQGY